MASNADTEPLRPWREKAAPDAPSTATYPPGLYRIFWKSGGCSLAAVGMSRDGTAWLAPVDWAEPAAGWWGVAEAEPLVDRSEILAGLVEATEPADDHARIANAYYLDELLTAVDRVVDAWTAGKLLDGPGGAIRHLRACRGPLQRPEVATKDDSPNHPNSPAAWEIPAPEGGWTPEVLPQRTSRQSTSTSIDPGDPPTGSASTIASSSDP